jgi:hypothetical protein
MAGDEIQIGSVVLAVGDDETSSEARPPRIRVVEGQNFGDELLLDAENREYVIGRNPKADLILEDREVSREHIKVVRRGSKVFIFDAASTRGSWLGRAAVYQGSRIEWQRPRMLKLGASVLALDLPPDARGRAPAGQASAPMTPPPRKRGSEAPKQLVTPPPSTVDDGAPSNFVAYHYEAKVPPPSKSERPPAASVPPAQSIATPPAEPAYRPSTGPRTAWKKTGPTIGRASGLMLLALAGVAVLGVLFVVFTLME